MPILNPPIETLEVHSAGQPVRVVTDGIDFTHLSWESIPELRRQFAAEFDHVRRHLNLGPRGHEDLVCSFPVTPGDERADLGLFFTDKSSYLDMCGDGTIGTISAFVRAGRLPKSDQFTVETPIGLVDTTITYNEENELERVSVNGIETVVVNERAVSLPVDDRVEDIAVSLVFAGHFYGLVDVTDVGLDLTADSIRVDAFRRIGTQLREKLNDRPPTNPLTGETQPVAVVLFYDERTDGPDANLIVSGDGAIGRGPCGTGTCAKMGKLFEEDRLGLDEPYPHRGPFGTEYLGRLDSSAEAENGTVLQASVSGVGYLTGKQSIVWHPKDEFEPTVLS
ncbi:proline racemase family protein [Natrarchaeobius oligotrophus]|uniref:Proline racemase n=1 Tax=Natrarchaeobius chitinivorans TaxID=1679083 RepID=A0A3N6MGH2_NATCH|nr:proline racemase family protein [Natrarchaeobius chitinivorans]RQH00095.1 hypothetical protein EA472_12875 [Natrarchaeobius chitinivorans]